MAAELDLLEQELERWAAMSSARSVAQPTSSSPKQAAAAVAPPPKPKKKRVRRQREELLYLRKKAKQLEDELERLTQREAAADDHAAADGPPDASASSLWKGIASRQLQVRTEAEDENRRLKRTLENQLTLARRFESFLQGSGDDPTGDAPTHPIGTHCLLPSCGGAKLAPKGDEPCFQDTMSELSALYAEVDQVLPLVGPRTATPTINNARVMEHPGANGVIIQWPTNVVVPFDWRVTARGMWRCIATQTVFGDHVEHVEGHAVSEDVVVRDLAIRFEEGAGAQWKARQVVRRFVEAERTVIVARSVWVSLDAPPGRLHGARFEESMQLVVCRSADGGGSSACVQGLAQMLPTCSSKSDAGELTELVLRSFEHNMRAMWPAVQSALIEEDLGSACL